MSRVSKKSRRQGPGQTFEPQYPISIYADLLPRNLHPVLVFKPTYINYMDSMEALYKLHKKECEYPREIDWEPLNAIRFSHTITRTLTQSIRVDGEVFDVRDFEKLVEIQEPIYKELCLEFLSTMVMLVFTSVDDDFLRFRLGGAPRSLSLRQFATYLDIYTEEELAAPWFAKYIMMGAQLDEGEISSEDWAKFSSKPYLAGKNPARAITDPKFRVIQKFLAHTITCRGQNTEKVSKADLWYMVKLKDRQRVNIPFCVGKFLYLYAKGTKPESRLCGGQFITRIAKGLGISLKPKTNPYTLADNPGWKIGIDMYRTAGVVRMKGGKYLPFLDPDDSSLEPRAGGRGKRPASQHASEGTDDEEEHVEGEDHVMHDVHGQGSQSHGVTNWDGFLSDFSSMRVGQSNFQDESRYEWGSLHYKDDYIIHNQQRQFLGLPEPTPYHQPPRWGEPGAFLPAPVYDRDAALVELQHHQEQMRATELQRQHEQQQTWGSNWNTPEPSQWQQEALHDWLFQPYQQPPRDPSQPGGSGGY